ncbi:MAG: PH domain-containing protein [Gemmataceae bacterium]|nr:PH domain-containing protein [Gemmataceae bacterium]
MHSQSEGVIWESSPSHWTEFGTHLKCSVILIVIPTASFILFHFYLKNTRFRHHLLYWLLVAGLVLWPLMRIFWIRLRTKSIRWTLSSDRLTRTFGVFSHQTDNLDLYRVQDMYLLQPFILRMVGCGWVKLLTTDKTDKDMWVGAIKDPTEFYELIRKHVNQCRLRVGVREVDTG